MTDDPNDPTSGAGAAEGDLGGGYDDGGAGGYVDNGYGDDGYGDSGYGDASADDGRLPVEPAAFPDLSNSVAMPSAARDLRLLSDIELELCVEIGRARLPLRQLLALTPGTVVELDRAIGEAVDVLVNGKLVAKGQVVTIGDEFGVRLSQIIDNGTSSSNGGSNGASRRG